MKYNNGSVKRKSLLLRVDIADATIDFSFSCVTTLVLSIDMVRTCVAVGCNNTSTGRDGISFLSSLAMPV